MMDGGSGAAGVDVSCTKPQQGRIRLKIGGTAALAMSPVGHGGDEVRAPIEGNDVLLGGGAEVETCASGGVVSSGKRVRLLVPKCNVQEVQPTVAAPCAIERGSNSSPQDVENDVVASVVKEFDPDGQLDLLVGNPRWPLTAVGTQPALPPGRSGGRKSLQRQKVMHDASCVGSNAFPPPKDYFMAPPDDRGAQARAELLCWHQGIARWRRTYWFITRCDSKLEEGDRKRVDEIFFASVHVQRKVEWELHVHRRTRAFSLSATAQHALGALDLAWESEGSGPFRFPVDTMDNPTYVSAITVPLCIADLYDVVRGFWVPDLTPPAAGTTLEETLKSLMASIRYNCVRFNGPSHQLVEQFRLMKTKFDREMKHGSSPAAFADGGASLTQQRNSLRSLFNVSLPHDVKLNSVHALTVLPSPTKRHSMAPKRRREGSSVGANGAAVVIDVDDSDGEDDAVPIAQRHHLKNRCKQQTVDAVPGERKRTTLIGSTLYEVTYDLHAECSNCGEWRIVTRDVSNMARWTCDMDGMVCKPKTDPAALIDVESESHQPRKPRTRAAASTAKVGPTKGRRRRTEMKKSTAKRISARAAKAQRPRSSSSSSSSSSSTSDSDAISERDSDFSSSFSDRVEIVQKNPKSQNKPQRAEATAHQPPTRNRKPIVQRIPSAAESAIGLVASEFLELNKNRLREPVADSDLVQRYRALASLEKRLVGLLKPSS